MFSYVYILQSKKDDKLYVGCTNDLRGRLQEHNDGVSRSTKSRMPFKLIYYEAYLNRKDAEKRERFFKSGYGRRYMNQKLHNYLKTKV